MVYEFDASGAVIVDLTKRPKGLFRHNWPYWYRKFVESFDSMHTQRDYDGFLDEEGGKMFEIIDDNPNFKEFMLESGIGGVSFVDILDEKVFSSITGESSVPVTVIFDINSLKLKNVYTVNKHDQNKKWSLENINLIES